MTMLLKTRNFKAIYKYTNIRVNYKIVLSSALSRSLPSGTEEGKDVFLGTGEFPSFISFLSFEHLCSVVKFDDANSSAGFIVSVVVYA